MNTSSIALSLLEASVEKRAPKDILADLFPVIYTASKRMSGREISDFLQKKHGINISQPTIARALKEPKKYTGEFARWAFEHANAARVLMNLEDIDEILTSEGFASFLVGKANDSIPDTSTLSSEYEMTIARDALTELLENWFKVSQDFRDLCWPEIRRRDEERRAKNASR